MSTPNAIVGLSCTLKMGTAGSSASTALDNVKDVDVSISAGSADVTSRANSGWKAYVATTKDATLNFTMIYDSTDTQLTQIQTAFASGTPLAFLVGDNGGKGLDADWAITDFSISQPLEDGVTVSISAKPDCTSRNPAFKTT